MRVEEFDGFSDVDGRVVADCKYQDGPQGWEEEACPEEGFGDDEGAGAQEQVDADEGRVVLGFIEFVHEALESHRYYEVDMEYI